MNTARKPPHPPPQGGASRSPPTGDGVGDEARSRRPHGADAVSHPRGVDDGGEWGGLCLRRVGAAMRLCWFWHQWSRWEEINVRYENGHVASAQRRICHRCGFKQVRMI